MDTVSFTDSELLLLRNTVGERLSEKRFLHTLGVEREAAFLGEHLIPGRVSELRAAALLHDIAKEIEREEQLALAYSSNDPKAHVPCPPPALHSFAGAELVKRDFTEFATDSILSAISYHTLGDGEMTLFDIVIYISDYVEETRTHADASRIRNYLHRNLENSVSFEEKRKYFYSAVLDVIECTLSHLKNSGIVADDRTLAAQKAICSLI